MSLGSKINRYHLNVWGLSFIHKLHYVRDYIKLQPGLEGELSIKAENRSTACKFQFFYTLNKQDVTC